MTKLNRKMVKSEIEGYLILDAKAIRLAEKHQRIAADFGEYDQGALDKASYARKLAQESARASAKYLGLHVDTFIDMVNDPDIIDLVISK